MALVDTHPIASGPVADEWFTDTHFQINHLAQMHLMLTLLPLLRRTASKRQDTRVVVQASSLHSAAPSSVKFASLDEINTDIGPSYLYNRSKLAQILFIRGLVQRLNDGRLGPGEAANIFANATHPGAVNTTQPDQAEEAYGVLAKIATPIVRTFMVDPITEGCLPALFAATAPEIKTENITGQYVSDLRLSKLWRARRDANDGGMDRSRLRIRCRSRRSRHRIKCWPIVSGS